MTVLYLDPYFLGDPLFLGGFARDLAARPPGAPLVVVHGSGEAGERAVEATGVEAVAAGGVWHVPTDAARAAVERATRELNRSIVHELNESNVAAVRVLGVDRGLLRADGAAPRAGTAGWLAMLARQGAVPVVGTLAHRDGRVVEVDAAASAAALAQSLGAAAVTVLLKGRAPTVVNADGPVARLAPDALGTVRGIPDADALRRIVRAGTSVRMTTLSTVRAGDSEMGTHVTA